VIAQIDPEEFFDYQANRPTIRLTEGQSREIEWPGNVLLSATPAGAERDLVLLAGTEPNLRWRTFADGIADAAETLGVEMVVTLGALIADVAHTLPVPITGLASDEELVERLDLARSSYEGPTGVVGVLHDACGRRGIPSASLWAAVPHYVAAVPNPKAALALLRRLEGLVGVAVEASGLEEESDSYESQVSRAVAANPEIEELVQRLEAEQVDRLDVEDDVPSGESLARDFERYLRQQGGGPEG
jgi:proteasome assembly chaperone (PAC2) family protein